MSWLWTIIIIPIFWFINGIFHPSDFIILIKYKCHFLELVLHVLVMSEKDQSAHRWSDESALLMRSGKKSFYKAIIMDPSLKVWRWCAGAPLQHHAASGWRWPWAASPPQPYTFGRLKCCRFLMRVIAVRAADRLLGLGVTFKLKKRRSLFEAAHL